jgi:hypothetical protein
MAVDCKFKRTRSTPAQRGSGVPASWPILVEVSVAATKQVLHQDDLDFAFLDVDVTNGKTFELAQILGRKHVPFVFVFGLAARSAAF